MHPWYKLPVLNKSTLITIKNALEKIMKKVLSVLAITLMLVGLTGCMDDPDGSQQHVTRNN